MSSIFSIPELAIGVGLSEAASAAFEPKVEVPKQSAWLTNPQRLPDLGLIAALVAGGKVSQDDGRNMANRLGFPSGTLDSVTWLAQNRSDFQTMLRLWRRFGAFSAADDAALEALVETTLAHEQLDWSYEPWLKRLKTAELIGLGDIAAAIVRGAVPAPSWVPVAPPATTDHVPRFPVTDIDPVQLAAALGFDEDMLRIMTARSGLSLAPILATQALFRGHLTANDWLLAIAEGDLRTEWAETLKEASREILTAGEYAELELRGFSTADERRANTAKHGMSDADSDLLYDVLGRAPAVHTITLGLARGGVFNGPIDAIPEVYLSSMQRGNIRPEYYNLEYATRYTYPSPFVMRSLAEAGDLGDTDAVNQLLLEIGWKPDLAARVSKKWVPAGAVADPHVKKAQTQLWAAAHKSYLDGLTDDADATTDLTAAGVLPASIPAVLALWQAERAIVRRSLTPAQIKKAIGQPGLDTNWALARLGQLGYTVSDAQAFLNE